MAMLNNQRVTANYKGPEISGKAVKMGLGDAPKQKAIRAISMQPKQLPGLIGERDIRTWPNPPSMTKNCGVSPFPSRPRNHQLWPYSTVGNALLKKSQSGTHSLWINYLDHRPTIRNSALAPSSKADFSLSMLHSTQAWRDLQRDWESQFQIQRLNWSVDTKLQSLQHVLIRLKHVVRILVRCLSYEQGTDARSAGIFRQHRPKFNGSRSNSSQVSQVSQVSSLNPNV